MKKNKLNYKGYSLVEALIVVFILMYIMVALLVLYINYSKYYSFQQAKINTGGSAREAVKELQSAVMQADSILTSHTISGTVYYSGDHTMVLELPSINGSGDVIVGKKDYVVFYADGKDLYRRIQADAESSRSSGLNKISDTLGSVNYTYNNADLSLATKVDVNLDMQTLASKQTVSYPINQTIYLRNK